MSAREAMRRGWCPSTLRPMETGDGWLVRLHPPSASLTSRQIGKVAELAAAYGNGLVEISARANLQIRGVSAVSHPALVEALLAEELVDEDGEGPQRVTLCSPLLPPPASPSRLLPRWMDHARSRKHPTSHGEGWGGGPESRSPVLDRFAERHCPPPQPSPPQAGGGSAAELAEDIEEIGRNLNGLPAKTGIVIDDGGPLPLDEFPADLRLLAKTGGWALGLPDGRWFGPLPHTEARHRVARLLSMLRDRHAADPTLRRMRDMPAAFLNDALAGLMPFASPAHRASERIVGLFPDAIIANLPFGRTDSVTLTRFAQASEAAGASAIRFSPWRGIACLGLSETAAEALLDEAKALGLITDPDDPRLLIQACAGSTACARAEAPSMADAATLAEAAARLLREGVRIHVSGCAKSCAHPGASDLTLVGRDGRYGVVIGGTTRDEPIAELDLCDILARLQPGRDIHARLLAGRAAGRGA